MFFFIILLSVFYAKLAANVIVETLNGKVQGIQNSSSNDTIFYSFEGIPYAKPPLGKLRFQAPEEVDNWKGIKNVKYNDKICVEILKTSHNQTEDCLFLNIYTPQIFIINSKIKVTTLLPVMFNIHEGGFYLGNTLLDKLGSQNFIDYNVVIVSVNYRLGPFGFLSTGDTVIPGNAGLKDQTMALKWVQKNIERFGGDPKKVVLMGQSAGAASVGYHLLNKKSAGLFRGAILQSGSVLCPWAYQRNPKQIALETAEFANYTGENEDDSNSLLEFFSNASTETIKEAAISIMQEKETIGLLQRTQGYFYAPVIEAKHENAFLTENMYELFSLGNYNKVPTLIGLTSEEMLDLQFNPMTSPLLAIAFDTLPQYLVPNNFHINDTQKLIDIGKIVQQLYGKEGYMSMRDGSIVTYMDDVGFLVPIRKQAELQSKYNDVYFYRYTYESESVQLVPSGALKTLGRVPHGAEMIFLWNRKQSLKANFTQDDTQTQKRLLTLWTNFAKYLNPTPSKDELLENVVWNSMSGKNIGDDNFTYLDIGRKLVVRKKLRNDFYKRWNDLYKNYARRPLDTY